MGKKEVIEKEIEYIEERLNEIQESLNVIQLVVLKDG